MAWSESAKQARSFAEYEAGLTDKQSYFEDTHKANWRQILARVDAVVGPEASLGPAASPPPRMRATANRQRGTPVAPSPA